MQLVEGHRLESLFKLILLKQVLLQLELLHTLSDVFNLIRILLCLTWLNSSKTQVSFLLWLNGLDWKSFLCRCFLLKLKLRISPGRYRLFHYLTSSTLQLLDGLTLMI